jgi:hypothetical protein
MSENMTTEHFFDSSGFDAWGYNREGHYDSRADAAPFQNSPFPHCDACDRLECTEYSGPRMSFGNQAPAVMEVIP